MRTILRGPEVLIAAIVGTKTRIVADTEVEREDLSTAIRQMLDMLTPREREVIQLRYAHGMIYRLIGNHFNICQERIRQIEAKALRKLRHPTRLRLIRRFLEPEFDKKPVDDEGERVEVVVREVE